MTTSTWPTPLRLYPYAEMLRPHKGPACYFADVVDGRLADLEIQHQEEVEYLHDIIAAYEAVTNPEIYPELFARSSAVLERCTNPYCRTTKVPHE